MLGFNNKPYSLKTFVNKLVLFCHGNGVDVI